MSPEQALQTKSPAETSVEHAPDRLTISIPELEIRSEQLPELEEFLQRISGASIDVHNDEGKGDTIASVSDLAAHAVETPRGEPLHLRGLRSLLVRQQAQLQTMSARELAENGETLRNQITQLKERIDTLSGTQLSEEKYPAELRLNEIPTLTDVIEDIPANTQGGASAVQVETHVGPHGFIVGDTYHETPTDNNDPYRQSWYDTLREQQLAQEQNNITGNAESAPTGSATREQHAQLDFEAFNRAQELQAARLKGNLLERGLSKLEKSPTLEAYRKMNWKKKVAFGALMATAGAAAMGTGAAPAAVAAGLAFRGLGIASVYTGFIEKARNKNIEVLGGSTNEAEESEITKSDRLRALGYTAVIGLLLPQALKEGMVIVADTELGQKVIGYAGDKISALKDMFERPAALQEATTLTSTSPEGIVEKAPIEESADTNTGSRLEPSMAEEEIVRDNAPEDNTPEIVTSEKVVAVEIQKGDTAYSVLRKMVPDIEELDGSTRQNNAIENIISKMKAHPGGLEAFGISSGNINELTPGESIDVAKIQNILDTTKLSSGKGILEHAQGLSNEAIQRIESFNAPAKPAPVVEPGRSDGASVDQAPAAPTQLARGGGSLSAVASPAEAATVIGVNAETLQVAAAASPDVQLNQKWPKVTIDQLEKDGSPYQSGRIVYDKKTDSWYDTGIENYIQKLQVGTLPEAETSRLAALTPKTILPEGTLAAALPEASTPAPQRLPEATLPAAPFSLNQAQLQALNAKQDQMILDAFYKTGSMRQNQGLLKNMFAGIFGTGNGAGAGRQVAEQIGTRIGQGVMSAQELAAAKAEWLKVKDIPASQIMSSATPGPLNALKTKLENLSMGVLPQPQPGQSFDSYMRNILANSIKQGKSINV